MTDLASVVEGLGEFYKQWKEAEAFKNGQKDAFFKLANEELKKQGLMLKLTSYEAESIEIAEERARLHHPGWEIDTKRPHRFREGIYEFVLIEDPSLKSYSYEHNGIRYTRQVSKGAVLLDDEWLKEDQPDLYEQVTFQLPWGERIPIPVEHISEALLRKLTKYIYNDKPRISLAAPREVKD